MINECPSLQLPGGKSLFACMCVNLFQSAWWCSIVTLCLSFFPICVSLLPISRNSANQYVTSQRICWAINNIQLVAKLFLRTEVTKWEEGRNNCHQFTCRSAAASLVIGCCVLIGLPFFCRRRRCLTQRDSNPGHDGEKSEEQLSAALRNSDRMVIECFSSLHLALSLWLCACLSRGRNTDTPYLIPSNPSYSVPSYTLLPPAPSPPNLFPLILFPPTPFSSTQFLPSLLLTVLLRSSAVLSAFWRRS